MLRSGAQAIRVRKEIPMPDMSLPPINQCFANEPDEELEPASTASVPAPPPASPRSSCADEALSTIGTCGSLFVDPPSDAASFLVKAAGCAGTMLALAECVFEPSEPR
jgi:hypothetical protein